MRLLGLALFACFLANRTKNQGITLTYQANIYGKKKKGEKKMYVALPFENEGCSNSHSLNQLSFVGMKNRSSVQYIINIQWVILTDSPMVKDAFIK